MESRDLRISVSAEQKFGAKILRLALLAQDDKMLRDFLQNGYLEIAFVQLPEVFLKILCVLYRKTSVRRWFYTILQCDENLLEKIHVFMYNVSIAVPSTLTGKEKGDALPERSF